MAKLDDAVALYIQTRDEKDALKKKHQEELAPYNEKLDKIEAAIMKLFIKTGQTSAQTPHGTPYISTVDKFTIADRDAFMAFVIDEGAWEYFTNAVSKPAVENYVEEHKALPPGIAMTSEQSINVRRGKK